MCPVAASMVAFSKRVTRGKFQSGTKGFFYRMGKEQMLLQDLLWPFWCSMAESEVEPRKREDEIFGLVQVKASVMTWKKNYNPSCRKKTVDDR